MEQLALQLKAKIEEERFNPECKQVISFYLKKCTNTNLIKQV
jgi:hypothetical protein